jgi:hypothetical protein
MGANVGVEIFLPRTFFSLISTIIGFAKNSIQCRQVVAAATSESKKKNFLSKFVEERNYEK